MADNDRREIGYLGGVETSKGDKPKQYRTVAYVSKCSKAKVPLLKLQVQYDKGAGSYNELFALFKNLPDNTLGAVVRMANNPADVAGPAIPISRFAYKLNGTLYRVSIATAVNIRRKTNANVIGKIFIVANDNYGDATGLARQSLDKKQTSMDAARDRAEQGKAARKARRKQKAQVLSKLF